MTKLDDLRKELKTLKDAAIEAIQYAQGKNRRMLEEALEQANAFAEKVEKDAKTASNHGDDAIADIENLDVYGARQDIRWASSTENDYGDCRGYRPAVEAVEAWAAVCEEVLKLRAIIHPA